MRAHRPVTALHRAGHFLSFAACRDEVGEVFAGLVAMIGASVDAPVLDALVPQVKPVIANRPSAPIAPSAWPMPGLRNEDRTIFVARGDVGENMKLNECSRWRSAAEVAA